MSEDRDRGSRDFSQYDSMTTEDLEEILRLDAEAPMEQESDTELILYVMEVLANRRNTNNTGKTAQESWESFQQHYLPAEEELPEYTPETEKPERSARPWLRRLIAAAAAIVLVLCIPLTAKAFGWEDIWNVVARWAKETFSFVSNESAELSGPDTTNNSEYKCLQDLLEENKIDSSIVPTWIPDGYVLDKIEEDLTPMQRVYRAHYTNSDADLTIRVQTYTSFKQQNIEIEEEIVEIYNSEGIDYYIFENAEQLRAVWISDSFECIISGNISLEDIKIMIDSVGKG
ncbi:MAG: DUF4367 domain-containing protein [Acetatifactor sp.]